MIVPLLAAHSGSWATRGISTALDDARSVGGAGVVEGDYSCCTRRRSQAERGTACTDARRALLASDHPSNHIPHRARTDDALRRRVITRNVSCAPALDQHLLDRSSQLIGGNVHIEAVAQH
jgi:hypothetical protein